MKRFTLMFIALIIIIMMYMASVGMQTSDNRHKKTHTPVYTKTVTPYRTATKTRTPAFTRTATITRTATPILQITQTPTSTPSGRVLLFSDEFDGTSLDLAKWRPNWLGGSDTSITPPINTAETGCYDPVQVSVANGELVLTAIKNINPNCKTRDGKMASYTSGMVQSNGHYNYTYGYAEARIWMPAGVGLWPAFWTNGQNWPQDGEIDIVECYGTDESCSYHYHYAVNGQHVAVGGNYTVNGSTTGWHLYAVNWQPGVITWYYDGVQVYQYKTGIVSTLHYIIVNLGLKSTSAPVPSVMRIDYVRVYNLP